MIKFKELRGEKEVEHFWWSVLNDFFPNCRIEARDAGHKTDGVLVDDENNIRTLIEVKEDLDFKKASEQAKVLIQSIFYIKQYEKLGQDVPKAIFVADKNEAFIVHTNNILKYLDYDVDWKYPASQAYKKYTDMLVDITNDDHINPFVFDIKDGFNFLAIKNKMIDLNQNVAKLIKITDENLQQVFEYFLEHVLGKNDLNTNQTANLFISLFVNPKDSYLHPKKRNTLYNKDYGYLIVNEKNFISFFEHFDGDQYTRKEKEKLTAILDRLIEDVTRRKKGEFFTPKPFCDLAHKYISDTFGEDWKEKFVVWDCAAGTLNLTRDYKFKELYCSTLEQSDIDTANAMGYNSEAVKFQFDFLNDSDDKLPIGLQNAINEGKEILFFINPPYAQGKSAECKGIVNTKIGDDMKNNNLGYSSTELYVQFLYKIIKYKNINDHIKIAIFSKPLFLSGKAFKKFRPLFFDNFDFKLSFYFNAGHFSNVSNKWGISMSIWNNDKNKNPNNFDFDVIEESNFQLCKTSTKIIYNIDDAEQTLSEYMRNKLKNMKTFDAPNFSNSLIIKTEKGSRSGKLVKNSLGYVYTKSNNISSNDSHIHTFSSASSVGIGFSIIESNFFDTMRFITARKSINNKWFNCTDEYMIPNNEHIYFNQFTYDSIIYSLFSDSFGSSSLRQVDYKDKKWDIKNEFFWMSKEEMMDLAEKNYYDEIYQDAKFSEERFVYNKLFKEGIYEKLSPLAKEVLDMATKLMKDSIKMRKFMSEEHPEYHLNSWDAGYAQMKLVWKEYFSDDFKLFRNKYKELEEFMRPLVYELGFLRK